MSGHPVCFYDKETITIMRVIIQENYANMCKWTANYIAGKINAHKESRPFILGLPTGSSPIGVYQELVRMNKAGELSFANVALLSVTDSSLVGGGVANEVGRFVIPCDEAEVIARFSFVGYGTVYRRTHIRNMGKIVMQPDNKVLKETVVEGSRFVQKVDRYVIIPDSILLAHCTDAVDVLKGLQLPGLEIDMAFKSLSVNGQEIVYKINGIPKELRDIQAIHPDQILRVEYSDNPSQGTS